ncbi:3-hydroxyisobutyrate dehydrogenase [Rhodococcus olei]|uniref:3-hydroxyisobutyrate dehydrogenase n=1 Tax=Rhodococcus olei TaxID=2161675 RepID=A0ABP8PPF2_9NOCA
MSTVACFGLGLMGEPIARRLLAAGHEVRVWNGRSPAAVERLTAAGAVAAQTPARAAHGVDALVTCLPDGDSVREVLFDGAAAAAAHAPDALVVDLSTVGPAAARSLGEQAAAAGLRYVDAPVSGGPAGAAAGTLSIFAGGAPADLRQAEELCRAFAGRFAVIGAGGQGQVAKMCNNLLVATIMLGNAQALALAHLNGIAIADLLPVLQGASGANWQMDNIVTQTVLADDYTARFALSNLVKDARLIQESVDAAGIDAPSFRAALRNYEQALAEFGPDADFSSVYKLAIGHG